MEIHNKNKKILRINICIVKFDLKYANMPPRVMRTVNKGKLHYLLNFTLIEYLEREKGI
jgi:hypothetical protein